MAAHYPDPDSDSNRPPEPNKGWAARACGAFRRFWFAMFDRAVFAGVVVRVLLFACANLAICCAR